MLTTILVLLIVLWLLGMVSSYTLGGFIHILLVHRRRRRADPRDPGPPSRLTGRADARNSQAPPPFRKADEPVAAD